jgi:hypothetical protein
MNGCGQLICRPVPCVCLRSCECASVIGAPPPPPPSKPGFFVNPPVNRACVPLLAGYQLGYRRSGYRVTGASRCHKPGLSAQLQLQLQLLASSVPQIQLMGRQATTTSRHKPHFAKQIHPSPPREKFRCNRLAHIGAVLVGIHALGSPPLFIQNQPSQHRGPCDAVVCRQAV